MDLAATTAALRDRGAKGTLVDHKGALAWRGTFTDSTGTRKQRRINLGLPAVSGQLLSAESRVIRLHEEIASTGVLPDPLPWDATPQISSPAAGEESPITVGEALELFKEDFWKGRTPTTSAERSLSNYMRVFKPLPEHATLTMPLLSEWARQAAPGTRTRLGRCQLFKRLAKLVDLGNTDEIDALKTPYEPAPRDLPSDDEVVKIVQRMRHMKWGWLTAAVAVYGTRPSEAFSLVPCDDGTAKVLTIKRRSKLPMWRTALALEPQWVEMFDLHNISRPWEFSSPTRYDSFEAERLSSSWGKSVARLFPHPIYDLRHAWAVRSIRRNLNASLAAKCMGHSLAVHHTTYHRWLEQSDVAAVAASLGRA